MVELVLTVYVSPVWLWMTSIMYCLISPFCRSNRGGCHTSSMYVGPISAADRLIGDPEGTIGYKSNTLKFDHSAELHVPVSCVVILMG